MTCEHRCIIDLREQGHAQSEQPDSSGSDRSEQGHAQSEQGHAQSEQPSVGDVAGFHEIEFGMCTIRPFMCWNTHPAHQLVCTHPSHNKGKTCVKAKTHRDAGDADTAIRMLKLYAIRGKHAVSQKAHRELFKEIEKEKKASTLPSHNWLDENRPVYWPGLSSSSH